MTERRETVSKNLVENVVSTLGTNSKKPNTVVMAINEDFIIDALGLFRDKKKGVERENGLVRLELVAVYVEEEKEEVIVIHNESDNNDPETGEQKIMDMTDELDEALDDVEKGE